MSRLGPAVLILSAAAFGWRVLGPWVLSGSERFYLLIPPTFLVLYAALAPDGWRGLKPYVRPALVYAVPLAGFCTGYYLLLASMNLPTGLRDLSRGMRFWVLLVAVYFLGVVFLLVLLPLRMLQWCCHLTAHLALG